MKKTSKFLFVFATLGLLASCNGTTVSSGESSVESSVSSEVSSESSSSEESSSLPSSESSSVDESTPIVSGTYETAVANAGSFFYANGEHVTIVNASEKDGTATIKFTVASGAAYDEMQIFYENSEAVSGSRYTVTFVLNSAVAFSGTVNGQAYDFIRGDNSVTLSYEESDDPSLVINFASDSESTPVSNTVSISGLGFALRQYSSPDDITIDGDLSDWDNLRAYENPLTLVGTMEDTAQKDLTIYASLTDQALYIAAVIHHDIYIDDGTEWWNSSNLEFFVNGANQYWMTANPDKLNSQVDGVMITKEYSGAANYETTVELKVTAENLPEGAVVAGQTRVGFAWKTPGDQITGGESAGGGYDEYWVPKGTWTNNADQTYVTSNGIFLEDQVNIPPTMMTIDGDLSDWANLSSYTTNFVYFAGTDDTAYKNVTFYARLTDEGLYLAALAHHDSYVTDASAWYQNTNFEFFINGANQFYIAANGAKACGTGIIVSQAYTGEANYESVAEIFIPAPYFTVSSDTVRVGFAWKTEGDTMTGAGGSDGAADAWWFAPGHTPNNADEQYYVTPDGIFADLA